MHFATILATTAFYAQAQQVPDEMLSTLELMSFIDLDIELDGEARVFIHREHVEHGDHAEHEAHEPELEGEMEEEPMREY